MLTTIKHSLQLCMIKWIILLLTLGCRPKAPSEGYYPKEDK